MDTKHMLIATDLSENSLLALHEGNRLALLMKARVTLMHVYDPGPAVPPLAPLGAGSMSAAIAHEVKAASTTTLASLAADHLSGVESVEIAAIQGLSAASTICSYAKEKASDLIVVSTHGHTGLKHMLLGSVAEKVVRHAPCSVFVVR